MFYLLINLILLSFISIKKEKLKEICIIIYIFFLILNSQSERTIDNPLIYKIILIMTLLLITYLIIKKSEKEQILLIYMSMIGLYILIESTNLMTIFLALELQAFVGYTLILNNKSILSAESALKYFLIGALASAIFILAVSFFYGQTNSIDFLTIFELQENQPYLILGSILILIALTFKIGAAPFHLWLPDAYTGASYEPLLFISIFPKIFLFTLIKSLQKVILLPINNEIIISLLLLSVFIGSLYAVKQQKIKRFITYTIIYNNGFFLALTLLTGYYSNYIQALTLIFYLISSFLILLIFYNQSTHMGPINNLRDLLFLQNTNYYYLLPLSISFFALIGIPPMSNFIFKIFLFTELIDGGSLNLTIFLIIISVLPSFYYLRVITLLHFKPTPKITFLQPINKPNSFFISFFTSIITISLLYTTELLQLFSN